VVIPDRWPAGWTDDRHPERVVLRVARLRIRFGTDVVVVLHDGRIAEAGPVRQIFDHPRAPATRALLDAVPALSPVRKGDK
jgi:ABC-type antimicrobial peptide transport system ATPase subunit